MTRAAAALPEQWRNSIVRYADECPDQLLAHPLNPKVHPKTQQDALSGAISEVGWIAPVIVNETTGHVIDGHARIGLAISRGEPSVPVAYVQLTEQAERLALATFDPIGSLAGVDSDNLAVLLEGLTSADAAVASLLRDLAPPKPKTLNPDDADLTPPAEPVTKTGDLWLLGDHRLLCGDATNAEDVARLMDDGRAELGLCDPPYNVGEDYVSDPDRRTAEEYEQFTRAWFGLLGRTTVRQVVTPGCSNLASWCRFFEPSFVAPWTKTNSMTRGRVSRFTCWEPIMFFGEHWSRERANEVFNYPISEQSAPGVGSLTRLHPCPKPLPLWVDLIENYSESGEGVVDLFAGVGPAVIASEQLGRRAFAMDREPAYVDVAVRRWERVTGGQAVKAHA